MSDDERLFGFQHVDKTIIQALFSEFIKDGAVEDFSLINSGMSTSNYIVNLAGQTKKYVLRIYPAENDHCQLEAASYRYAITKINVPVIYFVNHRQNIIPNSYLIMEYIEGVTLTNFILLQKELPLNLVYKISSDLGKLHSVEYANMALLNENMEVQKRLDSLEGQFSFLLDSYAGKHIGVDTRKDLVNFLQDNNELLKSICLRYVFSHGDFNFSNIIITPSLQPYFIDMEYCFSAPIYYDIGKFFRSKNPDIQKYITSSVKSTFKAGYNNISSNVLPDDWFFLAKLTDISAMLHMLNKPVIPEGWGEDIADEIRTTLTLF